MRGGGVGDYKSWIPSVTVVINPPPPAPPSPTTLSDDRD